MNLLHSQGPSFTGGEEKSFDPSPDPTNLPMKEEGGAGAGATQVLAALGAHEDARALVRLIQCRQCSKPYSTPVTLPCGHSLCRACLPPRHARTNISYPNTADRLYGIQCQREGCQAEHAEADCNVDVTLLKVMESINVELAKSVWEATDVQTSIEQIPRTTSRAPEPSERTEKLEQWTFGGGRLLATFELAQVGALPYDDEVIYRTAAEMEGQQKEQDVALLNRLREASYKELDCHVCYSMILDPVTTGCGHTFCRKCLARALDHSNHCPLCRRAPRIATSLSQQTSNQCLTKLLDGLCPELIAARVAAVAHEEHATGTESEVPLFICTLSFPDMPTFLHVFEPRYRLMMRRAMEGNRQFGMLLYNRSGLPQGDLGPCQFMEYGTILEIINIEYLPDGRSYVEARGISRFRVRSHGTLDGYVIGNVERVEDISLVEEERLEAAETNAAVIALNAVQAQQSTDPNAAFNAQLNRTSTANLLLKALDFIERMRTLSADWLSQRIVAAYGGPPDDPALFPYWFACVLPIAEEEKYLLLQTTSVRERLKIVNRWIRRIESQRWWVFLNSLPCLPTSPPPPFPPAYR